MSVYFSESTKHLLDDFCSSLKSAKSKKNYSSVIEQFCDVTGKDFLKAGLPDFLMYCDNLDAARRKGVYTYKTACFKHNVLYLFSHYIDMHGTEYGVNDFRNNMIKIPKPAADSFVAPQSVPTIEQLDKIYNVAKKNPMMHAIIALVNKCGLTSKQITMIRKSNFIIDANQNVGIILQFQFASNRYIKVPDDVVKILNNWMEFRNGTYPNNNSEYMFLNADGGQLCIRSLQIRVSKIMNEAFGPTEKKFSLQDLRNLSAVLMIKGGADKDEVADYLGINAKWIQRYSKAVDSYIDAPCDYINIKIAN